MSWNRNEEEKGKRKKEEVRRVFRTRFQFPVLAGIVAVFAAAVALFAVFRASEDRSPDSGVRRPGAGGRIAEAKPAAAPKAATPKAEASKTSGPRLSPTQIMGRRGLPIETYGHKTYRDEHGVLRYEGGLRVYDPNRPSRKLQTKEAPPAIFPHSSENAIAAIMTLTPGDLIVGEFEYGDDFIVDFNESLSHEIEYSADDTEYTRRVKDAVKAVKKELREAMNRGEDIAQIMNDAMNDLRNMAKYRQEIMAMVSETADSDDAPDEDVKDIIKAANMMFRERGIKEIDDNEFIRMSLILERERNRPAGDPVEGGDNEEMQ